MTGITIGGILCMVLFFVFLGLFTARLDKGTVERIVVKVLNKLSLLKGDRSSDPAKKKEE